MSKTQLLPKNLIADLNIFLARYEITATESYLNDLLEGTYAKKSMIKINGIDTAEREMFQSILAKKLTGMEWPCNMDSKEKADAFITAFMKAIDIEEGLSWIAVKEKV